MKVNVTIEKCTIEALEKLLPKLFKIEKDNPGVELNAEAKMN
ncbi:MAG TPA: hypothetical protein VHP31_11980 [Caproicibacter sp.]|nr:hypothetical protein [Caproicibacter sp.]